MDLERVLISVTGDDAPGLIAAIMAELAHHGVVVEDLAQAVIHDAATICIVVTLPRGDARAPILKDVLYRAHELGLAARIDPIDAPRWARWRER
ncbi:MAG: ACT domain-containing protein, partial [Pseudomonadales bacterium]|nr:ACT domain-containing protein [Pseudomonadales bacterium]